MLRLALLLLLIPLLDAVVLVVVADRWLGAVATVALVVLTALVGMIFVRAEGRRTIRKIQRSLEVGRVPANELLDGALLIAAGAFLLTPGLVTDGVGFLLVAPPTRIPIRMALKRWVVVPYVDARTDGFATGRVWTAGFPQPEAGGEGEGERGGEWRTIDLDDESYSVDE